jgi:hypothetical protein
MVLLLLIVTGAGVALTQVAATLFPGMPVMGVSVVSIGSEVDHDPMKSAIRGQLPDTAEERENWAWLSGAGAA